MTAPMALFALVAWLRHPYNGNKAEVQVNRLTGKETVFMAALTAVVTVVFYFLLAAFHTANLLLSTISVTTSFLAVYLTFRAKRLLRNCLRGKRYCIDFSMDVGGTERSFICVGNHMFCHIFGKRYLRLYQLAADTKTAGKQYKSIKQKTAEPFGSTVFY